jgi:hypothetical protein
MMNVFCFHNSTLRNMCALSNMDVVCIVNNNNNNNSPSLLRRGHLRLPANARLVSHVLGL